jgi:hypothetical protein
LTARPPPVHLGVRTIVALVSTLVLAGAGVFWWQRSQISGLRAQVAAQGGAIEDLSLRLAEGGGIAPADAGGSGSRGDAGAALRADERRLILDQYGDVLSQLNLPPEAAARLRYLLTDRVETVLDAENAAEEVGFARGSAETARAVALAIAGVDRDIVSLVGADGIRRIDGLPLEATPEPAVAPQPAPAPVVVTVVVQEAAPAPAYYADSQAQAPDTGAYAQYYTYPYFYSVPAVAVGRVPPSRFSGVRAPIVRERRAQDRVTFR